MSDSSTDPWWKALITVVIAIATAVAESLQDSDTTK
jgi:hypothetical protein